MQRSRSTPDKEKLLGTPLDISGLSLLTRSKGDLISALLEFIGTILRANFYCNGCHEDIRDEKLIRRCMCKHCKLFPSFYSLKPSDGC